MEHTAFVDRVFAHLPRPTPTAFSLTKWSHANRPTGEALAILPIPGVDPEKILDAVMDVDHYTGNIDHVEACRSIADPKYVQPQAVRFYQRVELSLLGRVQHELVLHRMEPRDGWAVAAWHQLDAETTALGTRDGFRSDYNLGCWIAAPGVLGYALSSAPRRDDVGFLKWQALTRGADAGAPAILKANLEGMARWAARR